MGLVSTLAHPDCQRSGTLQGSALAVEPRWYVPPSCSHDATGIIFFFFFFSLLALSYARRVLASGSPVTCEER